MAPSIYEKKTYFGPSRTSISPTLGYLEHQGLDASGPRRLLRPEAGVGEVVAAAPVVEVGILP